MGLLKTNRQIGGAFACSFFKRHRGRSGRLVITQTKRPSTFRQRKLQRIVAVGITAAGATITW